MEQNTMEQNTKKQNTKKHICECGKIYKERTGLWKHKKNCNSHKNASYKSIQNSSAMTTLNNTMISLNDTIATLNDTMISMVDDNQQMKYIMTEQYNNLQNSLLETNIKIQELQQHVTDVVKNTKGPILQNWKKT